MPPGAKSQIFSTSSSARTVGSGTTLKTRPWIDSTGRFNGRFVRRAAIGVAVEHHLLVALKVDEAKRPAARRRRIGVRAWPARPFGHDIEHRHLERGSVWARGRHPDRVVIDRVERLERQQPAAFRRQRLGVQHRIESEFDIARGHFTPVAEARAPAQMKNYVRGRYALDTLRQVPAESSTRVEPHQRVVQKLVEPLRYRVGREPWIERSGRSLDIDLDEPRRKPALGAEHPAGNATQSQSAERRDRYGMAKRLHRVAAGEAHLRNGKIMSFRDNIRSGAGNSARCLECMLIHLCAYEDQRWPHRGATR